MEKYDLKLQSGCELQWSVEKSLVHIFKTSIWKIGDLICCDNRMSSLRPDLDTKGIEVDFGPTAKAGEIWQASMSHVNLEGGCFVLTANQFCKREDNLLSL
ncbi:hypothetical protein CMV_011761 [Castanea mollissima]|uniref:CN hydrolase domain-containing protein n=1 Tax=Castanea mollissima TaxID=60419 RepID=A0A8J4R2M4_9ROSI|nr:hypothetical protein CMV_011761 [Castanea mollissima]